MNIIIIADGLFPTLPSPLALLRQADSVVCCDGALAKYVVWYRQQQPHPAHPVAVVGDGDSLPPTLLEQLRQEGLEVPRCTVAEQESNDLTKAVLYAVRQAREAGVRDADMRLAILGATGLREDHTLGNISLLAYYTTLFPDIEFRMMSDFGTFLPLRGKGTFASHAGQQVSLFSLTPEVPVRVSGLRYPICHRPLHWWWEGTLNEALGDHFEVEGGTMIVYQQP